MDSLNTAQHRFNAAVTTLPVPPEHKRNYSVAPIPGQMDLGLFTAGYLEPSLLMDCSHGVIRATCTQGCGR